MRCKNLLTVVFVAVMLLATANSWAQDNTLVLSKVRLYSGQCALSSGFGGVMDFATKDGSKFVSLELNGTLGQVVYGKTKGSVSYGPTFGHLSNAVWLAPIITYKPWKFVALTTWNGIIFGKPGHPSWEVNFAFGFQAIDFTFGNYGLGYSLLHSLQEKPMHLPYIKYVWWLSDKIAFDFSATYHVRDDRPMFLVAGSYIF